MIDTIVTLESNFDPRLCATIFIFAVIIWQAPLHEAWMKLINTGLPLSDVSETVFPFWSIRLIPGR